MARPNGLREKLAAGRTCVGPLFQEFWSRSSSSATTAGHGAANPEMIAAVGEL